MSLQKTNNIYFGTYLKNLRLKNNLTLKKLAELAKLSPSYLSRIERGERNIPNAHILKKLAPYLGISVKEMLINAGYLNNEATEQENQQEYSVKKTQQDNSAKGSLDIIKDPSFEAALEEVAPLSKDEKEGLLTYLKAIKLRRKKNK